MFWLRNKKIIFRYAPISGDLILSFFCLPLNYIMTLKRISYRRKFVPETCMRSFMSDGTMSPAIFSFILVGHTKRLLKVKCYPS